MLLSKSARFNGVVPPGKALASSYNLDVAACFAASSAAIFVALASPASIK